MNLKTTFTFLLTGMAMLAAPVQALESAPLPTKQALGDPCKNAAAAAAAAFDRESKLIEDLENMQDSLADSDKSCLSKYADMSIAVAAGIPDASSFMAGLMSALESAACQVVDDTVSQISGMAGQNMTLPGGMGYVNVGTFYNTGGGATVKPTITDTGYTAGSTAGGTAGNTGSSISNEIVNTVKNLFY